MRVSPRRLKRRGTLPGNARQIRGRVRKRVHDLLETSFLNSPTFRFAFAVDASPEACPFRGPFSFSYNRGHGDCKNPVSTVDSCSADWHILFRFQACADVQGTESSGGSGLRPV